MEKQSRLRRAVRKLKRMQVTESYVICCQERQRGLLGGAEALFGGTKIEKGLLEPCVVLRFEP